MIKEVRLRLMFLESLLLWLFKAWLMPSELIKETFVSSQILLMDDFHKARFQTLTFR